MGNLSKIKTIFWCREVFRKLGIGHPSEISSTAEWGGKLMNKLAGKDSKFADRADKLMQSSELWWDYYRGRRIPEKAATQNSADVIDQIDGGGKKREQYRTFINQIFDGTSDFFDAGPCSIFEIFAEDKFLDAVQCLSITLEELWRTYKPVYVNYDPGIPLLSSWEVMRDGLPLDSNMYFYQIARLDMESLENRIEIGEEGLEKFFFYTLGVAYIYAKFNRDNGRLIHLALLDSEDPDADTQLMQVSEKYQIPIDWWFEDEVFDGARQQFLRSGVKEVFPERYALFAF